MSATETSSKIYKPATYKEAISDPVHLRRWKEAIKEEIQNLEDYHTWEYDHLPPGRKAVGSKWVFKIKYHPDDTVARYKARLVAEDFSQIHGIDFNKTFSPTVRRESLRIFLAISCMLGLIVDQVDIVVAYLKTLLTDTNLPIFMKLPPGMESFRSIRPGLVARLLQSIYGLKQSGRLCNQKVVAFFTSLGFRAINADPSILIRHEDKDRVTMVSVYVDNFMLAAKHQKSLDWVKERLKKEYNIKDQGKAKTIIGWQITRNKSTMKIDQSAFIRDLVEDEGMRDCNPVSTPMKAGNFIDMQREDDYEEVNLKICQRLIGKLMYLSYGTRPNICFVIGQLSKPNADPRMGHLKAAKQVVQYLKGTMHLGLTYGVHPHSEKETKTSANPPPFGLIEYADSNYAGDPKDKKSVMGHCFFLHGAVVSWCSKK